MNELIELITDWFFKFSGDSSCKFNSLAANAIGDNELFIPLFAFFGGDVKTLVMFWFKLINSFKIGTAKEDVPMNKIL